MLGRLLVQQTQRVRQLLCGEDLQLAVDVLAGQMGGRLPATVEHQHAAVADRGGKARGCGVRDVVRHVTHHRRVEARQRGGEEARRVLGVAQP